MQRRFLSMAGLCRGMPMSKPRFIRRRACTKCGVEKTFNHFHRQGQYKRDPWCADCRNAYNRTYRRTEEQQAKRRTPAAIRRWRAYNQSRRCFIRHLARKFKLTWKRWEQFLVDQSGRCSGCNKPLIKYHIDHDHKSMKVRGLLCPRCNLALGAAGDSPSTLRALANYLEVA